MGGVSHFRFNGNFRALRGMELTKSVSALKVVALAVNLAILVYLLVAKRLFGVRGGGAAEQARRQADTGWAVLERTTADRRFHSPATAARSPSDAGRAYLARPGGIHRRQRMITCPGGSPPPASVCEDGTEGVSRHPARPPATPGTANSSFHPNSSSIRKVLRTRVLAMVLTAAVVVGVGACGSSGSANSPQNVQSALKSTANQSGLQLTLTLHGQASDFSGNRGVRPYGCPNAGHPGQQRGADRARGRTALPWRTPGRAVSSPSR